MESRGESDSREVSETRDWGSEREENGRIGVMACWGEQCERIVEEVAGVSKGMDEREHGSER